VAGVTGLEPAASGVTGRRSNQLSYTPAANVSFAVVALTYDPPLLLSSALGLVCEKSRETAARACGQRKGDGKRGMHLPSPTPTGRFTALESARLAANAPPPRLSRPETKNCVVFRTRIRPLRRCEGGKRIPMRRRSAHRYGHSEAPTAFLGGMDTIRARSGGHKAPHRECGEPWRPVQWAGANAGRYIIPARMAGDNTGRKDRLGNRFPHGIRAAGGGTERSIREPARVLGAGEGLKPPTLSVPGGARHLRAPRGGCMFPAHYISHRCGCRAGHQPND
jgi:hypothetical protein